MLSYAPPPPLVRLRLGTGIVLSLLALSQLAFLAGGIGGLLVAHVWHLYAAGVPFNPKEAALSGWLVLAGKFPLLVLLILAFIGLVVWMYCTHKNLARISTQRLRFSDWGAAWGWFLPRSAFIRPFEVMKEIEVVSCGGSKDTLVSVCGFWWAFWLVANFLKLSEYLSFSNAQASGADLYVGYGMWDAFGSIPYLISGICLMIVVCRIDRAQVRRSKVARAIGTV